MTDFHLTTFDNVPFSLLLVIKFIAVGQVNSCVLDERYLPLEQTGYLFLLILKRHFFVLLSKYY